MLNRTSEYTLIDDYIETLSENIEILKNNLKVIQKLNKNEFNDLFKEDNILYNTESEITEDLYKICNNKLNDLYYEASDEYHILVKDYKASVSKEEFESKFNNLPVKNTIEIYKEMLIEKLKTDKMIYESIKRFYIDELKYVYKIVNQAVFTLNIFEQESHWYGYKRSFAIRISYDNVENLKNMRNSLSEIESSYFNIFHISLYESSQDFQYVANFRHDQKHMIAFDLIEVLDIIYDEFNHYEYNEYNIKNKENHRKSLERLIEIANY